MKPSIAIVGCGRMGTALAKTLSDRSWPIIGTSSLHQASAQKVAALCHAAAATDQPWEITPGADVVFLTTPDGVIASVCNDIARHGGFSAGAVVLHCSGAHASTILSAAHQNQAWIGSMHPLQSFASVDLSRNPFRGIRAAIEGDAAAISLATRIIEDLEATPLHIATSGKPLYHAAAVVASNFLVTLMGAASRMIQQAGVSSEDALVVLKPLIDGTLANIERAGVYQALTGPVVRGDLQTIETHIRAMEETMPDILPLYRCLVHYTALLAREGNRISEDGFSVLQKVWKPQEPPVF